MEHSALLELEAKENEEQRNLSLKIVNDISKDRSISEVDLYKGLKLKEPYTYCVGTIKPTELVPYFQTVIVDLRPLPTPDAFIRRYGLSVERLLDLIKRRRVALRLRSPYPMFNGLHFLDELLEKRPPSSRRYRVLFPQYHDRLVEQGKRLFRHKMPHDNWWLKEYKDWKEKPSFLETASYKYSLLGCYTTEDVAEKIFESAKGMSNDPDFWYKVLHVYSRCYAYPRMNSLDGMNSLPAEDLRLLKKEKLTVHKSFPVEIGKALIANLELNPDRDLDLALKAPQPDWMKAVLELDHALDRRSENKVNDRGAALANLLNETRSNYQIMRKDTDAVTKRVAAGSLIGLAVLGVTGPLAASLQPSTDWLWIAGALLFGGTAVSSRTIAECAVKFRKPSHITAYFNLAKKVEEPKTSVTALEMW